jgi:AbrB family looped-hinge helix DNA binding protein
MRNTRTGKGQVTIPKKIRDALRFELGSVVGFDIDGPGRIIICKAGEMPARPARRSGRLDRARGRATIF